MSGISRVLKDERFYGALIAFCFLANFLGGTPVLRHDWPAVSDDPNGAFGALSGWSPAGFGSPSGYPSSFAMSLILITVNHIVGPYLTGVLFFAATSAVILYGTFRLTAAFGTPKLGRIIIGAFVVFNPWVYNQVVAGHAFMLLSYGAVLGIAGEIAQLRPSALRLTALAFALVTQIQFFVLGFFFYAYIAIKRKIVSPLLALTALALPIVCGVIVNHKTLSGIPFTLAWERHQSLTFPSLLLLRGYFANYDAALGYFGIAAMTGFAVCAAFGAYSTIAGRRGRAFFVSLVPVMWSLGVHGPLAGIFIYLVTHRPESALFRELYDLLAYLVLAYAGWLALAFARMPQLIPLGGAAIICGAIGWVVAPPATFWISDRSLPSIPACARENHRVALFPAFQPLAFVPATGSRRGSGLDPDAKMYARNIQSLNEMTPTYPAVTAFRDFEEDGHTGGLAALSVDCIIERPYLSTEVNALRNQRALPDLTQHSGKSKGSQGQFASTRSIASLPELTLSRLPFTASFVNNIGAGNVLFADLPDHVFEKEIHIPTVAGDEISAAHGWVDARLAFAQRAAFGQAFGGVLTQSPKAEFAIQAPAMLAWIEGSLLNESGMPVARGTGYYRWYALPRSALRVHCLGTCVIAATASALPPFPVDPPPAKFQAVPFHVVLPWLINVELPAGPAELLRYNVRYDAAWTLQSATFVAPHVRIDTITNGWYLPARTQAGQIQIYEKGAVIVSVAEAIALCAFLATLLYTMRKRAGGLRQLI